MAYRTTQSHPHENCRHRFCSVHRVADKNFLVNRSTFTGRDIAAIKPRGDLLINRRIRKQVACELFDRKLIERFIGIEGTDDPLAILPQGTFIVEV